MLPKSIRIVLLIAAFAFISSASVVESISEFTNSNISLPEKVAKFYFSLSNEEKESLSNVAAQLQNGAANFSLSNSSFMDTLKSSSQDLFLKFTGIRDAINSRLQKLSPEAFQFMEDLIRRFLGIFAAGSNIPAIAGGLSGFGKEAVTMYDKLSDKAKTDLSQEFPTVTAFLTSDISRVVLNRIGDLSIGAGKLIEALMSHHGSTKADSGKNQENAVVEEINKVQSAQLSEQQPFDSRNATEAEDATTASDDSREPIEDIVNERVTKIDVNEKNN